MRKLIYALVILLAVIFIIAQFAEVRAIMDTLQWGDWRFIFLAFGVQLLWLVNVALSYQVIFRATGILENFQNWCCSPRPQIFSLSWHPLWA